MPATRLGRGPLFELVRRLSRTALVVVCLTVPVALVALAHAFPPDPTWAPGLYDDADYDDMVSLAASTVTARDWVPPTLDVDLRSVVAAVSFPTAPSFGSRSCPTTPSRGPPSS